MSSPMKWRGEWHYDSCGRIISPDFRHQTLLSDALIPSPNKDDEGYGYSQISSPSLFVFSKQQYSPFEKRFAALTSAYNSLDSGLEFSDVSPILRSQSTSQSSAGSGSQLAPQESLVDRLKASESHPQTPECEIKYPLFESPLTPLSTVRRKRSYDLLSSPSSSPSPIYSRKRFKVSRRRTFPLAIPFNEEFSLFYRRFPISARIAYVLLSPTAVFP